MTCNFIGHFPCVYDHVDVDVNDFCHDGDHYDDDKLGLILNTISALLYESYQLVPLLYQLSPSDNCLSPSHHKMLSVLLVIPCTM